MNELNFTLNYVFVGILIGGKKNRQKERRLMKGLNLALPATQGMNTLAPVAEFMSPFHSGSETCDYYGSTFAGLLNANQSGITPRRNPTMYSMQQYSSSQSSFSESFGTIGRLGKIGSKIRNTSQKRRWGNSIKNHQSKNSVLSYQSKFTNFRCSVCWFVRDNKIKQKRMQNINEIFKAH